MKVQITEHPTGETERHIAYLSIIEQVKKFFREHPEIDEAIKAGNQQIQLESR
ncbi:MAG: hypothetical protein K2H01_03115 [Ruminococcus sp.]|nr:hypothetical protein [Ruminococcus sp.]